MPKVDALLLSHSKTLKPICCNDYVGAVAVIFTQ